MLRLVLMLVSGRRDQKMGRTQSPQHFIQAGEAEILLQMPRVGTGTEMGQAEVRNEWEVRDMGRPWAIARTFSEFSATALISCLLGRLDRAGRNWGI